jgi:hypothetical protein
MTPDDPLARAWLIDMDGVLVREGRRSRARIASSHACASGNGRFW